MTHNTAFLATRSSTTTDTMHDRNSTPPEMAAGATDLADSGDEEEGSDCDEEVSDGEQRTQVGDEGGLLVGELESLSAGPKA